MQPSQYLHSRFLPYAILPVLVTVVALVLSMLCVFAGSRPGYLEEYAVFTLNTSRIGDNILLELDNKILLLNLSKVIKRSNLESPTPIAIARTTVDPTSTTLLTLAPEAVAARGLSSLLGDLTSEAGSLESQAGSKATAAKSKLQSQASALESAAASKVDNAFAAAETKIVEAVNKAYENLIDEFDLKDFYAVHLTTTCSGMYVHNSNGTNVTQSNDTTPSPAPANGTTHERVDACSKHSFIDPVLVVRILYEIGIVFIIISLLLNLYATFFFGKKSAMLNILATLPAIILIGLASAAVHGVAVGAAELVNFVGGSIGIRGEAGRKFIAMSWACTILLLADAALWTVLFFLGDKLPALRGKGKGKDKEHELKSKIGPPQIVAWQKF